MIERLQENDEARRTEEYGPAGFAVRMGGTETSY